MKVVSLFLLATPCFAVDGSPPFLRGERQLPVYPPGLLKKLEEPCTAVLEEVQYDEAHRGTQQDKFLVCETPSGLGYRIPSATPVWIKEKLKSGDLKSGETQLSLPEDVDIDETTAELILDTPPGLLKAPGLSKAPGLQNRKRRLAVVTGDKTVLVVRVISADSQTGFTEIQLGDSVFGDAGDQVNLKSQYDECSHGKINMVKTNSRTGNGSNIANGVTTVTTTANFTEVTGTVAKNKVCQALKEAFGVADCGDLADHVMMCMPPTTDQGIAYAWVNSWLSVYKNQFCTYVSAQMHEIGHNLNLGHSGEGSVAYDSTYGDQTGMMGYSYGSSDYPKMCFNAFKFWQLRWFHDTAAITVNPVTNTFYEETLASFVDYVNGAPSNPVVLIKIDDPTSDTDYYMLYNAAASFNLETIEGRNQVTIVRGGGEGLPQNYRKSLLVAKLSAGGTFNLLNFAGTGDLVVTVYSIDIGNRKAYIRIQLITPEPTPAPSDGPSKQPPSAPSDVPSKQPTTAPSDAPSKQPTTSPSDVPSKRPATAQPTMSQSDVPSRQPSVSPSDMPPVRPSVSPSDVPSKQPTMSPSDVPSKSPTDVPSKAPTPCLGNKAACLSSADCCSGNCKNRRCRGNRRQLGSFPLV